MSGKLALFVLLTVFFVSPLSADAARLDTGPPALITISGVFNHDIEPGYDFVTFQFIEASDAVWMSTAEAVVDISPWSGTWDRPACRR